MDVEFYDVKTRQKVSVPETQLRKTTYEQTNKNGSTTVRYALRGNYEGRNLTKFVSEADWRQLNVPEAGVELLHSHREHVLVLVEIAEVEVVLGERWLALEAFGRGHHIANVVGEQVQPIMEALLVQQPGLLVQEPLDPPLQPAIHAG